MVCYKHCEVFVLRNEKHKISHGYSPADDSAGSRTLFEMTFRRERRRNCPWKESQRYGFLAAL